MAKITKTEEEVRQQNVAEAVSKTDQFFKENSKLIYGCVTAVLLIAIAALAYSRFYLQPKRAEAEKEMIHAEQWFQSGEYQLALASFRKDFLSFRVDDLYDEVVLIYMHSLLLAALKSNARTR